MKTLQHSLLAAFNQVKKINTMILSLNQRYELQSTASYLAATYAACLDI